MIPALAYFGALYLLVHLNAQRSGIGSLPAAEIEAIGPMLRRSGLISPPLALIAAFASGVRRRYGRGDRRHRGLGLQLPAGRIAGSPRRFWK